MPGSFFIVGASAFIIFPLHQKNRKMAYVSYGTDSLR